MDTLKTFTLLSILTSLFIVIGFMVGGANGAIIALLIAVAFNLFSWWGSDKLVLSMYKAKPVSESSMPHIHNMLVSLSQKANMTIPKLYTIDSPQPNAFATGRDEKHGVVVLSTGIIELLNNDELETVIAHELAHIKHRDTLIMAVAATIGGAITMIAQFLQFSFLFGGQNRENNISPIFAILAMIIMPIASMMIQMSISRTREYKADRTSANLTKKPHALANALRKIEHSVKTKHNPISDKNPSTAHFFIINPLTKKGSSDNLFSTHPSTANRIEQLNLIASSMNIEKTDFIDNKPVLANLNEQTESKVYNANYNPWA